MMGQSGKVSGHDTSYVDTPCPSSKDAINEKGGTKKSEEKVQRNSPNQNKNGTLAFVKSNFSNERSNNVTMVHEEGAHVGKHTCGQFLVELPSKTNTNAKVEERSNETGVNGTNITNADEKRKSRTPTNKITSPTPSAKTFAERMTHKRGTNEVGVNETRNNDGVFGEEDKPVVDTGAPQLGHPASDSQNISNEKKKKKKEKKKKKTNTLHGVRNETVNESIKEQEKGATSLQYDSWHEMDDSKGEDLSSPKTAIRTDKPNKRDSVVKDTQRGMGPTSVVMLNNEDIPASENDNRENPPDGWPKKKITLLKRNEMKYEKYTGRGNYPVGSTPAGGKNWHPDTSQKTLEQREKEYRKIRARIFSNFNKKKNSLKVPDDCIFKDSSNVIQDRPLATHFSMPIANPYSAPDNSVYGTVMNNNYDTTINNMYSCAINGSYASVNTNPYGSEFCNLPPGNHDGHIYTQSSMHIGRVNGTNDIPPPPPSFYPNGQTVFTSYMYDIQNQSGFSKTGASFPFSIESNANCYSHYKNMNCLPARGNISKRGKTKKTNNCTKGGDVRKDNQIGINQQELNSGHYNNGTYIDGMYPTGIYNNDAHKNGLYAYGLQSGIPPNDPVQGTALMNLTKQHNLINITHVETGSQMTNTIQLPNIGRAMFKGKHFTSLSKNMNQDICKKNKPPMDKGINSASRKKGGNGIHNNIVAPEIPRQIDFLHGGMENLQNTETLVNGGATSRRKKKENVRGVTATANAYPMKNTNLVNTPPSNCLTNDEDLWGNINQRTIDDVESAKGKRIQPGTPPFSVNEGMHTTNQQHSCTAQSEGIPEEQFEQGANEEGTVGAQNGTKREQKNACPVQVNVRNEGQGRNDAQWEGEGISPSQYSDSQPRRKNPSGGALTNTNDNKDTHTNVVCLDEGGKNKHSPNLDDITDNGETKGKKKKNNRRRKKKNVQNGTAKGTVTTMGSSMGSSTGPVINILSTSAMVPPTVNPHAANGSMTSTTYLQNQGATLGRRNHPLQKYSDPLLAIDELEYCRDISLYERRFDRGNNTLENSKRYDVDFPSLY
ncbi:Uncharacterized protein PKNOH_S08506400 [Plasmodium knowlesi]|uniref:SUZ domain-containing protein n=1 Tax=Plasmodium knowlesi TaxID=5850 RepID=A0A1Y3DTU4_PLAKN|nr:Uncharacterized protein PKNOH_S08506400 [Plasmodium knowlesi]